MPRVVVFSSFVFLLFLCSPVLSQFPWVCTENATLDDATCCPTSGINEEVCGGQGRGKCLEIPELRTPQSSRLPLSYRLDDRLEWPLRFFKFGCVCEGNFWGYACQRCKPGWAGLDCQTRKMKIRRNILSYSKEERRLFTEVLSRSKTEPSDMAVLNVTSQANGDPISKLSPPIQFYNVSVYNLFVYLHLYAARATLFTDNMQVCPETDQLLDFAHKSSGFPIWHRYYLLIVEAELDDISRKYFKTTEEFTLPYWDWIDQTECTVCTDDIVGATNFSDPFSRLKEASPFSNWTGFCDSLQGADVCHTCDPEKPQPTLWRTRTPYIPRLPIQSEVDYLMSLTKYDTAPYNVSSDASSFRNVLEGFVDKSNTPSLTVFYMHNLVHTFMNGTWFDVASSPNDPLFWLHHCFVDKLLELWIRRNKINNRAVPVEARIGHGRYDAIVPFFPQTILGDYMVDSRFVGYDYDNEKAGVFDLKADVASGSWSSGIMGTSTLIMGVVLGVLVLGILTFSIIRWRRSRSNYNQLYEYVDTSTADESTPLVHETEKSKRGGKRKSEGSSGDPVA